MIILCPNYFPFLCSRIRFQPWRPSILRFVKWLYLVFLPFTCPFAGHPFLPGSRLSSPFLSYSESPWNMLDQLFLPVSCPHLKYFSDARNLPEFLRGFSICFLYALHIWEHAVWLVWFITNTYMLRSPAIVIFEKLPISRKKWKPWPFLRPVDSPPLSPREMH